MGPSELRQMNGGTKKKTRRLSEHFINTVNDDDSHNKRNDSSQKDKWNHQWANISMYQESGNIKGTESTNQGYMTQ